MALTFNCEIDDSIRVLCGQLCIFFSIQINIESMWDYAINYKSIWVIEIGTRYEFRIESIVFFSIRRSSNVYSKIYISNANR